MNPALHADSVTYAPPYFPNEVLPMYEATFLGLASKLSRKELYLLARTIRRGNFNGTVAEKDLFGTLAKGNLEGRERIAERCELSENDRYLLRHWFFQVTGWQCICARVAPTPRPLHELLTLKWIDRALRARRNITSGN